MIPEQEERIVKAFEGIAGGLNRIANIGMMFFEKIYPAPKPRKDATVTHVKTEEELLREAQGGTEETLEEWMNLEGMGPREREWLEREKEKRQTANLQSSPDSPET